MKLLFTFLVSILLIEEPTLDQIYQHPLLEKAESLKDKREYEQAFTIYHKAANEFKKNDNTESLSVTYSLIGALHSYLRAYDSASYYLDLSISYYTSNQLNNTKLLSDLYYRKGLFCDYTYQPDSAIYFHESALEIRLEEYGSSSNEVASSQRAIADVYKWVLQDFFNAEKFYLQALKARKNTDSIEYDELAKTFYSLATTYRSKGEHDKAITYAMQALNNFRQNALPDSADLAACYGVIANSYFQTTQWDKAIPFYHQAIRLAQGRLYFLADIYKNLGATYTEKTQYDSARSFIQKSLQAIKELAPVDSFKLAKAYQQIGTTYIETDLDSAIKYYDISIRAQPNNYNHHLTVFIDKAKLYNNFYAYDDLIQSSDSALFIISEYEELKSSNDHVSAIGLKALGLQKKYKLESDPDLLSRAYAHYEKMDDILSSKREGLSREQDKLNLADSYRTYYEQALSCVYELMHIAPNDSLQNTFLHLMERNKAQILLKEMQKYSEYSTTGILLNDSLFLSSKAIEAKLAFLNAKLESINVAKNSDEQLSDIQQAIYANESVLENLQTQLKQKYPKLLDQSYTNEAGLNALKAYLQAQETDFLEYFWGDSAIYVYSYNCATDDTNIFKINELSPVRKATEELLNLVSSKIDFESMKPDYRNYIKNAHYLYDKLIPLPIAHNDNNKLLIVADRQLAYLPFEALLTQKSEGNTVNYRSLNYLLKSKEIRYAFSAEILLKAQQDDISDKEYESEVVVFSESVTNSPSQNAASIRGTGREAVIIGNLFHATSFQGHRATKENFLANSSESKILHIALHGMANLDNPLMGGLSFRADDNASSFLHYFELMNLNINAELAVLSACETGIGKFFDGEGIYNIARAFQHAGCQSIVSTLWNIDDKQTAELVGHFYKLLKETASTATALSKAKLSYLQASDEVLAHPRYWAGFVYLGQDKKINSEKTNYLVIIVGLILAVLVIYLFRKIN